MGHRLFSYPNIQVQLISGRLSGLNWFIIVPLVIELSTGAGFGFKALAIENG